VIVGAGNSAAEAAIDLAAHRSEEGAELAGWRDNAVSLVIRSNFKSDLKLGNKMMVYDCMDAGRVKAYFGQTVKEVTLDEVVLMGARERDPKTAKESARIKNDYVFALMFITSPFLNECETQILSQAEEIFSAHGCPIRVNVMRRRIEEIVDLACRKVHVRRRELVVDDEAA